MVADAMTLFHRTGLRSNGANPASAQGEPFTERPALFAQFHDLARLRYDFPLILAADAGGPGVETLSGRVDELLAKLTPQAAAGDRLRRIMRQVEREVRRATMEADGPLDLAWGAATERVLAVGGEPVAEDLVAARDAMHMDGILVDCRTDVASKVVEHIWRLIHERKGRERAAAIDVLWRRLGGLLEADLQRSAAGRGAAQLRAAVGDAHRHLFDFDAMAQLLVAPSGPSAVSESRRQRIDDAVQTLREQRFYGPDAHRFTFDSAAAAREAHRQRLREMAEVVRAIAVAELELAGGYVEAEHDAWLRRYDEPGPDEQALFPDYLVRLDSAALAREASSLLGALADGLPFKVVVSVDDPFGLDGQLAQMAMGLGEVFVIQATASQLYRVRSQLMAALEHPGPALLAIYTGNARPDLPPYLVAAAAVESRVVPSFTYDPSAGCSWDARLTLHDNPQPDETWPRHSLAVADEGLQRVTHELAFTPADFALCDPRHAVHFSRLPPAFPDSSLLPVDRLLEDGTSNPDRGVPFVFALGPGGTLNKLAVDAQLLHVTRGRGESWHRLQELSAPRVRPTAAAGGPSVPSADQVGLAPSIEAAPSSITLAEEDDHAGEEVDEARRDEAWIETSRCTSCNDCMAINPRLFGYSDNRQATILDPGAGTYRELVEAAECCPVAIIHPGRPRDANESGLEELLERAEAFR